MGRIAEVLVHVLAAGGIDEFKEPRRVWPSRGLAKASFVSPPIDVRVDPLKRGQRLRLKYSALLLESVLPK